MANNLNSSASVNASAVRGISNKSNPKGQSKGKYRNNLIEEGLEMLKQR